MDEGEDAVEPDPAGFEGEPCALFVPEEDEDSDFDPDEVEGEEGALGDEGFGAEGLGVEVGGGGGGIWGDDGDFVAQAGRSNSSGTTTHRARAKPLPPTDPMFMLLLPRSIVAT